MGRREKKNGEEADDEEEDEGREEDKDKDKDSTVVYTLLLRTHGYHNTKIRS